MDVTSSNGPPTYGWNSNILDGMTEDALEALGAVPADPPVSYVAKGARSVYVVTDLGLVHAEGGEKYDCVTLTLVPWADVTMSTPTAEAGMRSPATVDVTLTNPPLEATAAWHRGRRSPELDFIHEVIRRVGRAD